LIAGRGVRRDLRLSYVAAIVTMWTALVTSNSRGGIFSMLGQLTFVALLFTFVQPKPEVSGRPRRVSGWLLWTRGSLLVRIALSACLVTVVAAGVVFVGGDSLVKRLEVVPDEVGAEVDHLNQGVRRIEIWRATWQLIKDHPVSGIGFGGYATAIPQYHNASGRAMPQQAHNDYLELLASGGLIGVAFSAWFVVAFFRQARARLRSTDSFRRATCFGALAGLFGVAVHSLTDFGLHVTVNALVFVALVAIAAANGRVEKESNEQFGHVKGDS
jgi:O-antigen ligase